MNFATQVGPDTFVTLAYVLYGEDGDILESAMGRAFKDCGFEVR
jgi:hypothetical protein